MNPSFIVNNLTSQEKIKYKSAFKLFKLDKIVQVKMSYHNQNYKERLQLLKDMWKLLKKEEKSIYVQRSRIEKEKYYEFLIQGFNQTPRIITYSNAI